MVVRIPHAATSAPGLHAVAIFLTALVLGPALAHLLELPNKIVLGRDAYLQAQQLYRGWALLGAVVLPQVVVCAALAWRLRRSGHAVPALLAAVCALGAQVVFWTFTFPANAATTQWTMLPEDWERLRTQWEVSHAAGALLNLATLVFLLIARGR